MIVVSNTSPLTNLASIGRFEILRELFGEIHFARGVWEELNFAGRPQPGRLLVERAPWCHLHEVEGRSLVTALRRDLDRGEAETLALSLELGADLVLLDEREARHAAELLGLRPLGVLGILLEAKRRGLIPTVRPALDALRADAGFYLHDALYVQVVQEAGES